MRRVPLAGPLLGLLAFGSVALAAPAHGEVRVVDATGRAVTVSDTQRIVSIGGAVTEIVYALGLADRIVAIDSTSSYPEATAAKPNVGYMRRLSTEPILSLQPSVVLAIEDSGPPETLAQLREAGVPVVVVPDQPSAGGVLDKIALISTLLEREAEGQRLRRDLAQDLASLASALAGVAQRPKVLFLLSVGSGGAPLAAGRETAADGVIRLAGGVNAIEGFRGYKPLSPEAAIVAAPDVVVTTSRSARLLGGEAKLLALPEIALSPAGANRRVLVMDGLLLLGFGLRTGAAVRQLSGTLHPGLSLPAGKR